MSSTSTDEVQFSENIQRVYIGGLDQDRLPAQQILERLKQTEGIHVLSSDFKPTDTFLFINVVACNNGGEGVDDLCNKGNHKRPFEIIAAMYNNVRWKGCRLKVEAAKPHFLQKLANEIQQRKESKQQEQQQARDHLNHWEEHSDSKNNKIPRHLRIRRRRGDEVTKVDTKPQLIRIPCGTAHGTVPKRRKHSRALHIIFLNDDDGNGSTVPKSTDYIYEVPLDHDSDTASSSTEDDHDDDISIVRTTTGSRISHESTENQQQNKQGSSKKYVWSDDSDASSSSCPSSDIPKRSDQKETNHSQDNNGVIVNEDDVNLANDVSVNMHIYTQLFPDAVQTKQIQKIEYQKEETKDPKLDKHNKGTVIPRYDPTSAFSKSFEIQKCDARNEVISTSKRQEEEDVENRDKNREVVPLSDGLAIERPVFTTTVHTLNNIYHEKKLESIFQEDSLKASNGECLRLFGNEEIVVAGYPAVLHGDQPTNIYQEKRLETIFQEPTLKSKNMQGFHFFGNDKSSISDEENPSGFTFAFSSKEKSNATVTDGAALVPATPKVVEDLTKGFNEDPNKNRRRWQGFCFPQSVLNDWEDEFFAFNGGVKKLDEDDANDEWEEKRVALTLDWRRKYKQAIEKLGSHKRQKKN